MDEVWQLATVKDRLSEFTDRVQREHLRVHITKHGAPSAVLVAEEDLDALEETIAVLSDADLVQAIHAARKEGLSGGTEMSKQEALRAAGLGST